jgi:hypothetical protein
LISGLAVFYEQDSYRASAPQLVRTEPHVGVGIQHSDAGIGYRDGAKRFVIGMLWDADAAYLKFLHQRRVTSSL